LHFTNPLDLILCSSEILPTILAIKKNKDYRQTSNLFSFLEVAEQDLGFAWRINGLSCKM
jgi:hypothetical protein